ncbi:MAG: alpha/beta hydrolase [Rhizobacter sp.]|nr:alpha/beta hydrolase [Rhizobacter sp.]
MHHNVWILLALAAGLSSCATKVATPAQPMKEALQAHPCPEGVPADVSCLAGTDAEGAHVLIAMPRQWNGTLVVHAHGGPELGVPQLKRTEGDLKRWSVFARAGYAWAASSFRMGGVSVRTAAADTERVRAIFIDRFGAPRHVILHGQSWGASVAARAAETTAPLYDGVLLTSGVLGGGPRSYDFRLDLRVVYQAVCGNHPRPDEPQYPLWQGLPPDAKLTRAELYRRVNECTGVDAPAASRTPAQQRALKTLLDVVHVPERSLKGHLAWGTWHFQDIVFKRLAGRNPFGNEGVRYAGSDDDAALNARVARYRIDPQARADFAADTSPTGRIAAPVLTLHAIDDPIAFVELESVFRNTMEEAGTSGHLVQAFTRDHEHSYLSDAQYIAAIEALLAWVERGDKPDAEALARRCAKVDARFDPAGGCRFEPGFHPAALASRVPPR